MIRDEILKITKWLLSLDASLGVKNYIYIYIWAAMLMLTGQKKSHGFMDESRFQLYDVLIEECHLTGYRGHK